MLVNKKTRRKSHAWKPERVSRLVSVSPGSRAVNSGSSCAGKGKKRLSNLWLLNFSTSHSVACKMSLVQVFSSLIQLVLLLDPGHSFCPAAGMCQALRSGLNTATESSREVV